MLFALYREAAETSRRNTPQNCGAAPARPSPSREGVFLGGSSPRSDCPLNMAIRPFPGAGNFITRWAGSEASREHVRAHAKCPERAVCSHTFACLRTIASAAIEAVRTYGLDRGFVLKLFKIVAGQSARITANGVSAVFFERTWLKQWIRIARRPPPCRGRLFRGLIAFSHLRLHLRGSPGVEHRKIAYPARFCLSRDYSPCSNFQGDDCAIGDLGVESGSRNSIAFNEFFHRVAVLVSHGQSLQVDTRVCERLKTIQARRKRRDRPIAGR
jgi:hypothetical protein